LQQKLLSGSFCFVRGLKHEQRNRESKKKAKKKKKKKKHTHTHTHTNQKQLHTGIEREFSFKDFHWRIGIDDGFQWGLESIKKVLRTNAINVMF
jgi:hypothetical protein